MVADSAGRLRRAAAAAATRAVELAPDGRLRRDLGRAAGRARSGASPPPARPVSRRGRGVGRRRGRTRTDRDRGLDRAREAARAPPGRSGGRPRGHAPRAPPRPSADVSSPAGAGARGGPAPSARAATAAARSRRTSPTRGRRQASASRAARTGPANASSVGRSNGAGQSNMTALDAGVVVSPQSGDDRRPPDP